MVDEERAGVTEPVAPAAGWATGPLAVVQAADRQIARQTALRARAIAEFAATRPSSADRQPGEPGAMSADRRASRAEVLSGVSEWATQELVLGLSRTSQAAEALLTRSLTLVHRLPRTLDALEAGLLHEGHLWPMLGTVAPIADAKIRAEVEAELLAWAAGRVTTPAQLGDKARRVVLRRDARDAAGRLTRALRERGISVRPGTTDGTAVLSALLSVPEAQALLDALGRYADALETTPDDQRTRGQKMADCLLDLVLRPGENGLPPVQAQLALVAGVRTLLGGDQPGEVNGQVVPAEMVRALARAFGLVPDVPAPEVAVPPEPSPAAPEPSPAADADTAADATTPSESDPVPAAGTTGGPTVAPAGGNAPDAEPTVSPGARAADWYPSEEEQLADWWAATEALVLQEWGGEEDPPPEVQVRFLAESARWNAMPAEIDLLPWVEPAWCADDGPWTEPGPEPEPWLEPEPGPSPELEDAHAGGRPPAPASGRALADAPAPEPGSWAAADRAIEAAGAVLLDLERAVGKARRAVDAAEVADSTDEAARRDSSAGRSSSAPDALGALGAATDAQRRALAELLDRTGGGGLVDRPRIALVDELTGALVALTDADELRRRSRCGDSACRRAGASCTHDLSGLPGLGAPPPTDGYRPGARLDRFLRARDRRCRQPGCRRPVPRRGELDHDRPWPEGETSAANLVGYCTPHHRGKHQAPGCQHHLAPDGTLTVTTPSGLAASTTPPPY
ncbi:HNH endonuclease [Blastococcus sp. MG754426]|uniref:HNH endonuclease signature motif containing protein n=1 Tax=unclassified Blastococcus TaxID=2619396 RepID=UPI001EEFDE2E|nr:MULTISPECIES: HNH endonuclease signature motif containing protein [unclassified Blastococcus]MCF6506169.1 HNH endonuclease [Blastococcus sp. MG754426]MCF6510453.1 HNH endonuclease [Blastococcus sp. MG754427]